jgi:putative Holliday junction resolvase
MPDTPDLNMPQTLLAFDYGRRRIGVAVGQSVTASASPLGTVSNTEAGPDQQALAALIREWRPELLVVGSPAHADGSPSEISRLVEDFIEVLGAFGLPIDTVDERYTSLEAEAKLKDARAAGARGRITRESIDSGAAVLIAERYLAAHKF